jgi:hypothetical protein
MHSCSILPPNWHQTDHRLPHYQELQKIEEDLSKAWQYWPRDCPPSPSPLVNLQQKTYESRKIWSQNRLPKLKPTQNWRGIPNRARNKDWERASARTSNKRSPHPRERYNPVSFIFHATYVSMHLLSLPDLHLEGPSLLIFKIKLSSIIFFVNLTIFISSGIILYQSRPPLSFLASTIFTTHLQPFWKNHHPWTFRSKYASFAYGYASHGSEGHSLIASPKLPTSPSTSPIPYIAHLLLPPQPGQFKKWGCPF